MDIDAGFINLDKPSGPSSHEVTAWVKRILNVKKAGHAGTLDPFASGVLPIAFGRATRMLQAFSNCDKEYVGIASFSNEIDKKEIEDVASSFVGLIYQVPPEMSAVRRRLRKRRIYNIEILEVKGNLVLFKVWVQHGTYIRKLVQDWGEILGNKGKLIELKRTRAGPFRAEESITLQDLADSLVFYREGLVKELPIIPVEKGVSHLRKVVVRDSAVSAICHGAYLARPGLESIDLEIGKGELVAIFTKKGELVGLGEALVSGRKAQTMERGNVIRPKRIWMERDKYPKSWKKKS